MFAYIPARSGSKRIIGKNKRDFEGRPIISWVIEKIIKSRLASDIFVSTNDDEIADISINYGAKIVKMRDEHLCQDETTFGDLLIYDLPYYCQLTGNSNCLFMLPTAPLVRTKTLQEANSQFLNSEAEILMSTKPIYAYWALEKKGKYLNSIFPKYAMLNSQELPETFLDAGLFYFLDVNKVKKYGDFNLANKILGFPVSDDDGFDINTIDEWHDLELKFKNRSHRSCENR